jgi:hypothetical protein
VLAAGVSAFLAASPALAQPARSAALSISCPSVADKLPEIPAEAKAEVDRNLALLNTQITEADQRLRTSEGQGGPNFMQKAILSPLKDKRLATLERIAAAIGRSAPRPIGLNTLAACSLNGRPAGAAQQPGDLPRGHIAADFVDIRTVRPNFTAPRRTPNASVGSFVSRCGRNTQGQYNSDNIIAAPGVINGAHHVHDYVGNTSTNGLSNDESLSAAGTTCTNGDRSTYYWPVVRLRNGTDEDVNAPGGGLDGNIGEILTPASVSLRFSGNPVSKVTAMPRFLRIITGSAKAFTTAGVNARASWSCTGFENRRLSDKYPLCPTGSRVERILEFQSCWDGANIDSADHRTHIAYPDANGTCPTGTKAIPALEERITYNIPPGVPYALDSFPEQLHNPITDHGDFINVMSDKLMRRAVNCINTGQRCR